MNELDTKVRKYAATMRQVIAGIKSFPTAPQTLEEYSKASTALIQHQAYFIGLYAEVETIYKSRIEELQEVDGMSFSRAENKAQSEECFGTYKRAKLTYELTEEAVKLLKKLITARDSEYSMS